MTNEQIIKIKQQISDIREYLSTDSCCQCEKAKNKLDSLIQELNNDINPNNAFVNDQG